MAKATKKTTSDKNKALRYEFVGCGSNKFWEIKLEGSHFTTTWGKIGTAGQSTTKHWDSPAIAKKEHDKLIAEKVNKGYELCSPPKKKAKPKLRIEKYEVMRVNSYDLEEFIKDVTGQDFEFVADQEAGNDTQHEFDVDGDLEDYDEERVDEFLEGEYGSHLTRPLLNWLAKNGHIEKGTYLVGVCW